jgi:two-component system response regulator FixJ
MPNTWLVHIIDDDDAVRDGLQMLLEMEGFAVRSYGSAPAFLATAPAAYGCVVTDLEMPQMSALELMEDLRARGNLIPVVVMSGRFLPGTAQEAARRGAFAILDKPFDQETILAVVRSARQAAGG